MINRMRRARRHLQDAEQRSTSTTRRSTPSLARDAVVVAIAPGSGKVWDNIRPIVSLALLVELSREGRLDVSGTGGKARVTVRDPTPLGVEELDEALLTIGAGAFGQKVTTLLSFLPSAPQILEHLVATGQVTEKPGPGIGAFRLRRYRPTATAGREDLMAGLTTALLDGAVPDDRTAMLVTVLDLAMPMKFLVPRARVEEADRRAGEIREGLTPDELVLESAVQVAMRRSDGSTSSV